MISPASFQRCSIGYFRAVTEKKVSHSNESVIDRQSPDYLVNEHKISTGKKVVPHDYLLKMLQFTVSPRKLPAVITFSRTFQRNWRENSFSSRRPFYDRHAAGWLGIQVCFFIGSSFWDIRSRRETPAEEEGVVGLNFADETINFANRVLWAQFEELLTV